VGAFTVDRAVALDNLGPDHVLPPAAAVGHLPAVAADATMAEAVSYGKALDVDWPGGGPWAVLDGAGALLAVYERTDDGRAKPSVVLAPAVPSGGSPPT
jgi:hypothetical protein